MPAVFLLLSPRNKVAVSQPAVAMFQKKKNIHRSMSQNPYESQPNKRERMEGRICSRPGPGMVGRNTLQKLQQGLWGEVGGVM